MIERWVTIELDFCGNYQVSNLGRVKSLPRDYRIGYNHQGIMHNAGGVLHCNVSKGSLRVNMGTTKSNRKYYSVKKLVYEHFVGPLDQGYVVISKDGDPWNVELSNLEAISRAELLVRNTYGS